MISHRILITSALPVEQKILKKLVSAFSFQGITLDFLMLGVGNYQAIFALQEYFLTKEKPDFCLNIGVCGKREKNTPDDIFQVYRIFHLARQKETLCPVYQKILPLKSIASSEKIITSPEELEIEEYVDMESYGVDFICSKYNVPSLIFKIPFDTVSKESKNVALQDIEKRLETFPAEKVLSGISSWCEKNSKEEVDFTPYFSHYHFTHSEKLHLKKMYYKLQTYKLDFEKVFEEKKHLGKKEFLQYMRDL